MYICVFLCACAFVFSILFSLTMIWWCQIYDMNVVLFETGSERAI